MDQPERTIRVELAPRLPWQQKLAEALRAGRFVTAVMGRRAGKTTAAVREAALVALRGGTVFWGSTTNDQAKIAWDKFKLLFRPVITRTRRIPMEIGVLGGGEVLFRSFDRAGAAIGRGVDLAVVDEAARVKRQIIYEDLLPTVADTGGTVLAISTPRGKGSWFYEWHAKALAGDPLYRTLSGPSTENPDPRIREFARIAFENMPEVLYRQEVLGEFVEGEGGVFRNVRSLATLDGWRTEPTKGGKYVVGCDLAKHRDWTVLIALDLLTGECHGFDRFRGLDWPAIRARVQTFSERWNRAPVWLDSTGVGDAAFDDLSAAGVPLRRFVFGSESKSRMVVALMTALEKGEIAYPADDVLIGELDSYEYRELPSGRFQYSAPEGLHDDVVMALGLAVWGRRLSLGRGVARSGVDSFEASWHSDHDPFLKERF